MLARDRVGIRPLFYTWIDGSLAFASEVKSLFTLPGIRRALKPRALASVFSYWSALSTESVFDGVSSLPPGHWMSVDSRGARTAQYWDWSFGEHETASEEELAEQLHALLVDAVRLQLRADVPVGAYLSGGLDSSIVTALVRNHTETPLRTFSTTFEDAEFDETRVTSATRPPSAYRPLVGAARPARRSARHFRGRVWHAESPVVRTASTPMMLLADSVRAPATRSY